MKSELTIIILAAIVGWMANGAISVGNDHWAADAVILRSDMLEEKAPEGEEQKKEEKAPEGEEQKKEEKAPEGEQQKKEEKAPEGEEQKKEEKAPEGEQPKKEEKPEAPKTEAPAAPPAAEPEAPKPIFPPPAAEPAKPAAETPAPPVAVPVQPPKPVTPPPAQTPEKKHETFTLKSAPLVINTELDVVLWAPEYDVLTPKLKVWDKLKVKTFLPHGHFVKKGQTVVTFDREDYDRNLDVARRNLESARLGLAKTKITYELAVKQREMDAEDAKLLRQEVKDTYDFTVKWDYDLVKRSNVDAMKSAEMALENQKEELRQLEKMYRDDDLVEETEEIVLRRQRRVVEAAQLNFDRAVAKNEWTVKYAYPRYLRSHKRSYARVLWMLEAETQTKKLDLKAEDLAFKQAEVTFEAAQRRFQELEEDAKSLELTAPRDGYVYYGSFADGTWDNYMKVKPSMLEDEMVAANRPLLTIVDATDLILHGTVAEKDFSKIQTGQKGFFVPTAYPETEFPVKLTNISEMPVSSGTFAVQLSVDRDGDVPKVYPGMKGKVTLASIRKSTALLVPESAVGRNEELKRCVYVMKDGKPAERVVKLGRFTADKKYEILDGLEAGMDVVKTYTSVSEE